MNGVLPLVTIVTPSFNQGQFIEETIKSVLTQDYPNFEYIIVDGGSMDETAEIAERFSDRLRFVSEPDRGQSDAINKGFRMASGSIVAWLNSDDIFLPGAISAAVAYFLEHPECGAVYGEGYQIDGESNVKSRFEHTQPFDLWKLTYLSDYILQQTAFFRRSVFEEVGYLDESLFYSMDWDILTRIGKAHMLGYIPRFLGALREHGEAKTSKGGVRRFKEIARLLRKQTGMLFSPGFIVYGLDTYQKIWCAWLARHLSFWERLANKAQRVVTRLCHAAIGKVVREAQGWYSDGWASRRVRYMLPPSHGRYIELRVRLPELPFKRQRIVVRNGETVFARESFEPGLYTISVAVPERYWNQTLSFCIEAERWFVPGARAKDNRRLCYFLEEIGYSDRFAVPSA